MKRMQASQPFDSSPLPAAPAPTPIAIARPATPSPLRSWGVSESSAAAAVVVGDELSAPPKREKSEVINFIETSLEKVMKPMYSDLSVCVLRDMEKIGFRMPECPSARHGFVLRAGIEVVAAEGHKIIPVRMDLMHPDVTARVRFMTEAMKQPGPDKPFVVFIFICDKSPSIRISSTESARIVGPLGCEMDQTCIDESFLCSPRVRAACVHFPSQSAAMLFVIPHFLSCVHCEENNELEIAKSAADTIMSSTCKVLTRKKRVGSRRDKSEHHRKSRGRSGSFDEERDVD
jgi:hypothetical protein